MEEKSVRNYLYNMYLFKGQNHIVCQIVLSGKFLTENITSSSINEMDSNQTANEMIDKSFKSKNKKVKV